MPAESMGPAPAEAPDQQPTPFERSEAHFAAMSEPSRELPENEKVHKCQDGSRVYVREISVAGQVEDYRYDVYGPNDDPRTQPGVKFTIIRDGSGAINIPGNRHLKIGSDIVGATMKFPQREIGQDTQNVLLDQVDRMLGNEGQEGSYAPLPLTV